MKSWRFFGELVRINLRASLALRGAFLLQAAFMALNNLVYFTVWTIFFRRFHDLNGFTLSDMQLAYGIVAAGFGIAAALAGGLRDLSRMIVEGSLDTYLTQPKSALARALCSRTQASGWGDVVSGLAVVAWSSQVGWAKVPWLVVAVSASAVVFVSAGVVFHSAAFWLGQVESLARQLWEFMITFALYPEPIFGGGVRLLLYTLIPSAFAGFLPARLVHAPSLAHLSVTVGGAGVIAVVALCMFQRGLRRYESGNQVGAR